MIELKHEFSFIAKRKIFYIVVVAFIVLGLGVGFIRGFNMGIDFTGGTKIELDMGKKVETTEIVKILKSHDIQASVIYSGSKNEQVIIKTTAAMDNDVRQAVYSDLQKEFDLKDGFVKASDFIGPTVGELLKKNAIKAVGIAALCMLVYVVIRFEWMSGVTAIIALLTDVLILSAFYGLFNVQINSPFIAGLLTVVGYSINDTIVIFDRIRENKHLMKKNKMDELIDKSINQTLGRSIMTSLTTVLAILPLFIMGGESIREFTLPLVVGVLGGTCTSIFISSPLYYDLYNYMNKPKYKGK